MMKAQTVAEAAEGARAAGGRVVMEAFHYRYHPLMDRVLGLIADNAIGRVQQVQARFCFPLPKFSDIRWVRSESRGAR